MNLSFFPGKVGRNSEQIHLGSFVGDKKRLHTFRMSDIQKGTSHRANARLPPEVNRALYVRNLPFKITSEEMYDIFGKVKYCLSEAHFMSTARFVKFVLEILQKQEEQRLLFTRTFMMQKMLWTISLASMCATVT